MANAHDTFIASLLNAKVSHFSFMGEVTRYAVCNDIMDLPEIWGKNSEFITLRFPTSSHNLRKSPSELGLFASFRCQLLKADRRVHR